MKQVGSGEARTKFRDLLDEVAQGEHVEIQRYGKQGVLVVPKDWYEAACAALQEAAVRRMPRLSAPEGEHVELPQQSDEELRRTMGDLFERIQENEQVQREGQGR